MTDAPARVAVSDRQSGGHLNCQNEANESDARQTSADRGQRNSGVEMDQLPYWVVAVWFCGLIFFAARALNYTRLILNNLVPGKNYWDTASHVADHSILHTRFRIDAVSIDPALLTDLGQQYQKKGIRNNRIMFAWALGGFLLIGSLFSYLKA